MPACAAVYLYGSQTLLFFSSCQDWEVCISLLFPFFFPLPFLLSLLERGGAFAHFSMARTRTLRARAHANHAHTHSLGSGWRTFRCYATPDGGDGTPGVPEMCSDMSTVSLVLVEGKWSFGNRFLVVLAKRNRNQNNSWLAKFTQDSQWNQYGFLLLLIFRVRDSRYIMPILHCFCFVFHFIKISYLLFHKK